jgi:hypothetical protein
MGWLSGLFHRAKQCGAVIGDGKFAFHVVGTSHHQDILTALTGGRAQASAHHYCAALLVPQLNNPHSKDAVAVRLRGQLIGHLPDNCSTEFLTALRRAGYHQAACEALIAVGWDLGHNDQGSFGVRLNARMPFQFLSADQWQQLHNRA